MSRINFKNWKLRNKIILHLVVVGILSISLLFLIYIKTQKNIIHSMSYQKALLVGSLVEKSIFSAMKKGENKEVQATLEKIAFSSDIREIRIINPKGKIVRSSNQREIGTLVDSDTREKMSDFLKPEFATINNRESYFFVKPKSMIQGFRIIENSSECFVCHDSVTKINGILEVNIDYAPAAALLKKSQLKGIIIAIATLIILTFIIIRLFDKLVNRPISQLKEKMKKVQEGDLNIQISGIKEDEIGNLSKSFNEMIGKLKDANHKIEELFNRQLEKAEHLASIGELAAGLAHEIKNPIAGMRGALEIINRKTEATDPKKEIFAEMILQTEKVNNVIQDLLSYAKPREMNMGLVDPNICVTNAIRLANPQLNGKDIRFHIEGLTSGELALLDPDKIQELLLNLTINSISAIEKKGEIQIKLQKNGDSALKIIFSDDGHGIKKEYLPQIFNPFFTTKSRGTGLGLSICKKIIEAHNGSMQVQSTEKKGTTFIIQLPVLQHKEHHA